MQQPFRESATGLYGEALFLELLEREVARARRYARPLSLVLGRVPHNHPSVRVLSRRWITLARDVDFGAVLANSKWVMVLPETDRAGASVAAERFRRGLEDLFPVDMPEEALGLGVVTFPYHGAGSQELLETAERLSRPANPGVAVAEFPRQRKGGSL